jgi:hypothetical protein
MEWHILTPQYNNNNNNNNNNNFSVLDQAVHWASPLKTTLLLMINPQTLEEKKIEVIHSSIRNKWVLYPQTLSPL